MRIFASFIVLLALNLALPALAAMPPDVAEFTSCELCGMSRERFAHSRGLVEWAGGQKTGVCSINCVAAAMVQNPELKTEKVFIADHDSLELLNAREAHWVKGGSERGVMTPLPKWAFGKRESAEAFIKNSGGELTSYEEALKLARDDVKMRRGKR